MITSLVYKGIRDVVRSRMLKARFHAMLSLFVKTSTSVEAQRVARLVGNFGDDEDEFNRQSKNEFMKLVKLQRGRSRRNKVLDITELGDAVENMDGGLGLEGTA